jgi:phosphatidate cytidylyltransferase
MLKQRIITAIFLIPLVLAALFYTSVQGFQLILGAILLLGAWEWTKLAGLTHISWRIGYLLLLALLFYLSNTLPASIFIGLGVVWWFLALYFIVRHAQIRRHSTNIIAVLGMFALVACFVSLSFLRTQDRNWVILLFLIVWSADIAAYFAGRQFGKHLLAPWVSPKKTWEGFLGALLFVFTSLLVGTWLLGINQQGLIYLPLLGACTVIISVIGDLFESFLKRQVNIKDSGQLLPGHGGILDRIDSLIAAAPFFAMGIGFYSSALAHWWERG